MNVRKIYTFWILFLLAMPAVPQSIIIDTIKKTVLLDEKATISNGNLLRQGAELDTLYRESKVLIDSLQKTIDVSKLQILEYKTVKVPALENVVIETKKQQTIDNKSNGLIIDGLKVDLKHEKKKKWKWAIVGTAVGVLIGLFGGF